MFGRSKPAPTLSREERNGYLIYMRDIVKTFQTAAGPFTALKSVDLRVNPGEFVAIIGKSGSGKSTLINMLTGIDRPTAGEVYVGETAVHTLSEGRMAKWRGRNLGIVFQFFQLLPTLSLLENVMLPMDFCNMYSPRERKQRALKLLDMVGMADQANKLPSAVSGGQQQRVAIARALANDPPIVVADEPTGNLDSKTAEAVFELFENLVQQGKTIIMVTHDSDKAKRVHRAVIVSDGEVIEEYLARAFSTLTQEQLIWASHEIEPERHEPGGVIFHEGSAPDQFYIIAHGSAEVVLKSADGSDIVASRLTPGQYFGEIALLRGVERTA
ncbi:MAG: ATP-binding cassette domain-containing protein, partial [Chloroflexi bacterium]|nr:ATP-binding cassette domain-containing protein [Chloroflexota bacterium]